MPRMRNRILGILLGGLVASSVAVAQTSRAGEIVGTVRSDDGTALPGATVRLIGDQLIQREITQTTDARGAFRFAGVNPGEYILSINMDGFAGTEVKVTVHVGRTSTIEAMLPLARAAEQLVVRAEAPLVDKTSPQYTTNYTAQQLAAIPSDRDFINVVDTAPGFDNRMAFGAGGNVDGYDPFGFGAATNLYQINGISTSNLQFGNSWVNPNYDTIQEVQIVGPGAAAEYANFTGAVVNVVTKTGTNQFHGGTTIYGTSSKLTAENDGGIVDLEQPDTKYAVEGNAYIGGPIVPEKLLFFASAAYDKSENAPIQTDFFDDDVRQGYQIRFDFLANNANTFSAMYDYEPIKLTGAGLQPGVGPEVGYFREERVNTGYLSWVSTWNKDTISEVKYAGVQGYLGRIPNNTAAASVYDLGTGINYNSTGFQRTQTNWRHEGRANVTRYVDQFLNGTHEFKAGVEYEWLKSHQQFKTSQNVLLYLIPIGDGVTYVNGIVGYNYNQRVTLSRPGIYLQDKASWDRLTVNLGIRYDHPVTKDENTGNEILNFHDFSPRLGLSYDISGKGTTIAHAYYGRYYEKVPTYGPGTYAGTGFDPITYYGAFTDQVFDPTDWQTIRDFVVQPQNITTVFDTQAIPVEDGTKNPRADLITARVEHQFTPRVAASLQYLYRYSQNFITLTQFAQPNTYEPFEYTSPFNGRTFTSYTVTGGGPRLFALGNIDYWYQRTNQIIAEMRARPNDKSFLNASFAYEHTTGTRDNNECAVLSLCTNGVDEDPNYFANEFYSDGVLSQNRPFNFKILGAYMFPFGITTSADFRWFAGRAYGAVVYNYQVGDPRFNDPYYGAIRLEPKDERRQENSVLLNMRVQKEFVLGPVTAALVVDVLNVTNAAIDFNTNIQNDINAIYPRETTLRGETVSAFGGAYALAPPRTTRLGLRVWF